MRGPRPPLTGEKLQLPEVRELAHDTQLVGGTTGI